MSAASDAIARASAQARAQMDTLDDDSAAQLRQLYEQVIAQLQRDLRAYGDDQGHLRVEVLNAYLRQAIARLDGLSAAQRDLLQQHLSQSAQLGARPWGASGGILPSALPLPLLADAAARFVNQFTAADGLRLSDRLWRLDRGAKERIADVLRRNVVMGRDASRAAAEFLALGQEIPREIQQQLGLDQIDTAGKTIAELLLTGPGNPYANARRVFRTEMNRAHGEAYRAGAGAHPDVIGERFVLSPNHPKADICDEYARADDYGLGPGVYPVGKAPWPAHPNTMSYLEAVFRHEVPDHAR
ncbi:MAG TPA: hypothetical protein P5330_11130 [Candidatus Competibacteraceae bacterium]|nr:hypothetical protein [Candidatus Competibacteraceae bacterium]